jgi:hypothetical protein
MRKRSKQQQNMTESRRWWDCGMGAFAEWTFEGIPESEYGMTDSIAVTRWHI